MRSASRTSVFLLVCIVVSVSIPKTSQAIIINGSFEGEVTVTRAAGGATVPGGIGVGDLVSGTFGWDTDTAFANSFLPTQTEYTFLLQPNNFLNIVIGGLTWASGIDFSVLVTNDDAGLGDLVSVRIGSTPTAFPGSLGGGIDNASLAFGGDPSVTNLIDSLALPSSLDLVTLAGFSPRNQIVSIHPITFDPDNPFPFSWSIDFEIDPNSVSLESVETKTGISEPATMALLGFGLLSTFAVRSRRASKQSRFFKRAYI